MDYQQHATPAPSQTKHIVLAVTGASGAIYAKKAIEKICENNCNPSAQYPSVHLSVIFTQTAKEVFAHETGCSYEEFVEHSTNTASQTASTPCITFIDNTNFHHKYASGSNKLDALIILPCSMGSLARIAQGLSADLIGRIADVQLKERRPLLLVPREAPYSLIHLRNMTSLTEAGATIIPASPSFYSIPQTLNDLIDSFVERILDIAGIAPLKDQYKW